MKINGRMSHDELKQLVCDLSDIKYQQLKNIYHYGNYWEFKFQRISLVFEHGIALWIGSVKTRETKIHSVCAKLRKELVDQRIQNFSVFEDGRTLLMEFKSFNIILEVYAKGNVILTDKQNNIIVLTRIFESIRHNQVYQTFTLWNSDGYTNKKGIWKTTNEVQLCSDDSQKRFCDCIAELWLKKGQKTELKEKKVKLQPKELIQKQINELENKLQNMNETNDMSFEELEKFHTERKLIVSKLEKAQQHLSNEIPKSTTINPTIKIEKKWYHEYHWWYTKNNFLVVGGKNADQNEKLVKYYLKDNDYYFHTQEPGSGSFILFANDTPSDIDLDETAEGVFCFSNSWKSTGVGGICMWVMGNQVSKSPPSGEYIVKGSFIITGKQNFIKVDMQLTLGYVLVENELMCAPYRIVNRYNSSSIKLTPKIDSKKSAGKKLVEALRKTLNIKCVDDLYLFPYPCNISQKIVKK